MSKNYPILNTAQEVLTHLEEEVLTDEQRVYYLQKLRLEGAASGYVHKEK